MLSSANTEAYRNWSRIHVERTVCTSPTVTRFAVLMAGGADFSLSAASLDSLGRPELRRRAQGRLPYTRLSARGRTKENR